MPIIVSTSDDFTDLKLSSRRIIIYGAGAYCMRLLRTMESSHTFKLSSIACIIDGNPKKQGAELEYAGKRFPICSPDILCSLDPSSHVVIISSRKYTDRMMETILQTIPSSPMPVIADCYRIFRSRYDTVEELLASNPISQDGLRHSEWCKDESTVLHLFHSTFEHVHGEIKADFFNLSDIFEYMSTFDFRRNTAVLRKMANPFSAVVYYNMQNKRYINDPAFELDEDLSRILYRQNQSFFYRDFLIYNRS